MSKLEGHGLRKNKLDY